MLDDTGGLPPGVERSADHPEGPPPVSRSFLEGFRDEVVALLYCLGDKDHDPLTITAMLQVRESLDTLECELDPSLRSKLGGRV